MNYRRNEDRWPIYEGAKFNFVHDVTDISDTSPSADSEPVSVEELKAYLRLEGFQGVGEGESAFTEDDDLIEDTVQAAREYLEEYTKCSLIPKTLKALVTNMCGGLEVPFGPVRSAVTGVYEDESGDLDVETSGFDFPKLKTLGEKMVLTYEAGYDPLPKALKRAVMIQAGYMYMNRGETLEETGVCKAARELAAKYRRGSWLA